MSEGSTRDGSVDQHGDIEKNEERVYTLAEAEIELAKLKSCQMCGSSWPPLPGYEAEAKRHEAKIARHERARVVTYLNRIGLPIEARIIEVNEHG